MDIDDRMKAYEKAYTFQLPIRMPVVIRLDGKCFHSLTKNCDKPFDIKLRNSIVEAVKIALNEIPARFAYHQSDEISLLFVDYNKFNSQQWFDGLVQKMVSVSASIVGVEFSRLWGTSGYFDSRVFTVPERDIKNYFISRQQDCIRNAISMAARSQFSAKELYCKPSNKMIEMLSSKGIDFDQYPSWFRFGSVITRSSIEDAPIFTQNQLYLQQFLAIEEE